MLGTLGPWLRRQSCGFTAVTLVLGSHTKVFNLPFWQTNGFFCLFFFFYQRYSQSLIYVENIDLAVFVCL